MFQTRELTDRDAAVSYPLVSCRYPGISLESWADFVRAPGSRGACESLVGLLDSRQQIHALFGYALVRRSTSAEQLHVEHIATFRLAGNAIYRAFDDAVETLARERGCREIQVVPWAGVDPRVGPVIAPEDVAIGRRVLSISPATLKRNRLN